MEKNYSTSLLSFYNTNIRHRLMGNDANVLDIGSGNYSIFEETQLNKDNILAIDLKLEPQKLHETKIEYIKASILEKNNEFKKYNLVFDSHCLHCLNSNDELSIALENIYNLLSEDGIFATEMMVQPNKNGVYFPGRNINEALDIENLVLKSKFTILYFVIVPNRNFYYEVEGQERTCDMLRVIAKK